MKTILLSLSVLFLCSPLRAENQAESAKQLLLDGLFEEEANADLVKAEATYRKLIDRYDAERRFAGTAMFRLGEIARKRGDKAAAAGLFRRVASEFGDQAELVARSQKRLGEIGVVVAKTNIPNAAAAYVGAEESLELSRLKGLQASSPDLLDGVDKDGLYPLHRAAMNGWGQAVDYLLAQKVNVDSRGSSVQLTPLHLAVIHGHLGVAQKLMAAGADMDATFQAKSDGLPVPPPRMLRKNVYSHWTPLHLAVLYGRREVAGALMKAGASQTAEGVSLESVSRGQGSSNGSFATPFILALWIGDEKMIRFLVEVGVDLNQVVKRDGNSTLVTAARMVPSLLPYLLEKGMKVNDTPYLSRTPLLHVVHNPKSEALRLLVENGADVNAVAADNPQQNPSAGSSVLGEAIEVARYANDPDAEGNRPLYSEDVRYLLSKGAKPGPNEMSRAVSTGLVELVRMLIDAGGDPNAVLPGPPNQPVLHLARSAEVANLLIEKGAKVEGKNSLGETTLQSLFKGSIGTRDEEELAELLLAKGADPSVLDLIAEEGSRISARAGLAPFFLERLRYRGEIDSTAVKLAFPFQGKIVIGEKRVIEGTPAPTLGELLATPADPQGSFPSGNIQAARIFRLEGEQLKMVQLVADEALSTTTTFDIQWGDIVELQVGSVQYTLSAALRNKLNRTSSRSNSNSKQPELKLSDLIRLVPSRTFTLRCGPWSNDIEVGYRGLFLKEHLPESSRIVDLSKVQVTRNSNTLTLDCRLGVDRPLVRLVAGDVIEIPLAKEMTEDPKGERWKGIRIFHPDFLRGEKPKRTEPMTHNSVFAVFNSNTTWPRGRDFSKVEILRSAGGKMETIPLDLQGIFESLPQFEWTREKLIALNVPLQDGDVLMVPPTPGYMWAGNSSESSSLTGALKLGIDFLAPPKSSPSSTAPRSQPRPSVVRPPTRTRRTPTPPTPR